MVNLQARKARAKRIRELVLNRALLDFQFFFFLQVSPVAPALRRATFFCAFLRTDQAYCFGFHRRVRTH